MKKIFVLVFIFLVYGTGNIYSQQWEVVNKGLYGGSITKIAIKDSIFVAADYGRGIFISMDYGKNWREANTGLAKYVFCVDFNGATILAGTSEGLYYSTNNGANWKRTDNIIETQKVLQLAIKDSTIYIVKYGLGLKRSEDNGFTWTDINNGLKKEDILCLALQEGKIFAGAGQGLYVSLNKGLSWSAVGTQFAKQSIKGITVFKNYICLNANGRVYLSNDFGKIWKQIKPTVTPGGITINDFGIFVYSDKGICKSTDEGQSWTEANSNLSNIKFNDIVSHGFDLFAGTDNRGVFLSKDNGGSWSTLNNGLANLDLSYIFTIKGNLYIGQDATTTYISTNDGNTWSELNNGLTGEIKCFCDNNTYFFAGTNDGLFISKDKGLSWENMQIDKYYGTINGLASMENKMYLISDGCTDCINRSIDEGKTWKDIAGLLPNTTINHVFTFKDRLFIGGYPKYYEQATGVFLLRKDGDMWKKVLPNLIRASAVIDNTIFIAGNQGVYRSDDNGESWILYNKGMINQCSHALVVVKNNIFVGTDGGVYVSKDYGENWIEINNYVNNLKMGSLTVNNGYLYVVYGGSVFRLDISALSVDDEIKSEKISISPNPSSDLITISLQPSEGSEIQIYNTLGEIVATPSLLRNATPPMEGNFQIDISALPKGMYFLKIGDKMAKFVKM